MSGFRHWLHALTIFLFAFLTMAIPSAGLGDEQPITVNEITPNLLVIGTSSGNVVASVGPDGVLLVGTPSVSSTAWIQRILAERTKSSARHIVIFPLGPAESEGDAGWGVQGAFVAMHENAVRRLGGGVMGAPGPLPPRIAKLGVDRPRIAFSEVLAFDLNGESIHIVHQKPGFSDADALAHFHVANLFYLGEAFPGDGYPRIDTSQGGTLEGLLDQLSWTDSKQRIVPARGDTTNGKTLEAFRDMIMKVRDRVQRMVTEGRSEKEILAAHPTADFDSRWGHGRVSADTFVHEIYASIKK